MGEKSCRIESAVRKFLAPKIRSGMETSPHRKGWAWRKRAVSYLTNENLKMSFPAWFIWNYTFLIKEGQSDWIYLWKNIPIKKIRSNTPYSVLVLRINFDQNSDSEITWYKHWCFCFCRFNWFGRIITRLVIAASTLSRFGREFRSSNAKSPYRVHVAKLLHCWNNHLTGRIYYQ